jgi:HEPN domain-containing protein
MTPEELLRSEAGKWLRQAAMDLNAARLLVEAEPTRSLFHSQQAAEKAAKAFLAYRNIPFRKTHDLADLGGQCAELNAGLEPVFREAADLTDYASAFRYPEAPYEPDAEEATQALGTAERLCRQIRSLLPDVEAG